MLSELLTSDLLYKGFIGFIYLISMGWLCYIAKWLAEISMRFVFPFLIVVGLSTLFFTEFLAKLMNFTT